jgi:hypothetical protein
VDEPINNPATKSIIRLERELRLLAAITALLDPEVAPASLPVIGNTPPQQVLVIRQRPASSELTRPTPPNPPTPLLDDFIEPIHPWTARSRRLRHKHRRPPLEESSSRTTEPPPKKKSTKFKSKLKNSFAIFWKKFTFQVSCPHEPLENYDISKNTAGKSTSIKKD